jgi:catechol-2,3-dioxygenase
MSAIIFLETKDLAIVDSFYREILGLSLWLDQGVCRIYRDEHLLIGFCQKSDPKPFHGILTWFYPSRAEVDAQATKLKDYLTVTPRENSAFRIYQCFAADPEGRTLEFQQFLHPVDWQFAGSCSTMD